MIAVLHSGAAYHLRTLADPQVAKYVDLPVYLPDLAAAELAAVDTVIVCDRTHPALLRTNANRILQVAKDGGTVVVLGEVEAHTWLPGLRWTPTETNFWWWRTAEDPGIRMSSAGHPSWQHLGQRDVTWHFHGVLHPPAEVTALVRAEIDDVDAGLILYEDLSTYAGRLIVTTLDPTYHHGSNFMPGATGFLYGLLSWVAA